MRLAFTREVAQRAALALPMLLTAWVVASGAPIEPERASLLLVLMHYSQHASNAWSRTRQHHWPR